MICYVWCKAEKQVDSLFVTTLLAWKTSAAKTGKNSLSWLWRVLSPVHTTKSGVGRVERKLKVAATRDVGESQPECHNNEAKHSLTLLHQSVHFLLPLLHDSIVHLFQLFLPTSEIYIYIPRAPNSPAPASLLELLL